MGIVDSSVMANPAAPTEINIAFEFMMFPPVDWNEMVTMLSK
jgi:hypothetical protein